LSTEAQSFYSLQLEKVSISEVKLEDKTWTRDSTSGEVPVYFFIFLNKSYRESKEKNCWKSLGSLCVNGNLTKNT